MKELIKSDTVPIPEGVTVDIKARQVRVKGPRGTLTRNFRHMDADIVKISKDNKNFVKVEVHFGRRLHIACIRTVCSHIRNMVIGVTKGFRYKMRFVYAHFPINALISDAGDKIEIRNFLGEKVTRVVNMLEGVTIVRDTKVKDQVILEGNDIENVSQSAASIHGICLVRNKDIRKFLDGIYVSEKGNIVEDE